MHTRPQQSLLDFLNERYDGSFEWCFRNGHLSFRAIGGANWTELSEYDEQYYREDMERAQREAAEEAPF